jgi:hypothetical protein
MPKIPNGFIHIARRFHQDIFLVYEDENQMLASLVQGLSGSEKQEVRNFLSELLSRGLSDDELCDIWDRAGPSWGLEGEGAREFFEVLRQSVASDQDEP